MSEAYRWTYLDADGQVIDHADGPAGASSVFPTQGDAEAWFAESWEGLAEAGVSAVTLKRDGAVVYGPMSLEPAD